MSTALGRPRTFLNIVLDESGSMDGTKPATLAALNAFVDQQRALSAETRDEVLVSLVKFNDKARVVYTLRALGHVAALQPHEYQPDGGTALHDGIFFAIRAMEKMVGERARVLTLVVTDGGENESVEIPDVETMRAIIRQREARGNWTFVFLSAGPDPYGNAQAMGFQPGNVQPYTAKDVGDAIATMSRAVRQYRADDAMQTSTFYAGPPPVHERPQWTTAGDEDVEDVV